MSLKEVSLQAVCCGPLAAPILTVLLGTAGCASSSTETERAFDYAETLAAESTGDEVVVDEALVEPDPFDAPPTETAESTVVILAGAPAEADATPAAPSAAPDDAADDAADAADPTVQGAEDGADAPDEGGDPPTPAPTPTLEAPSDLMLSMALAERRREFRRCYARSTEGLLPRPALTADVTLGVDPAGWVTGVTIDWRVGRPPPGLSPCLEAVAGDLSFPGPFVGPSEVTLPLVFDPGES